MKLLIDIPEDQINCKCEFYFKVLCDNGSVDLSNKEYLKERYGIDFMIPPQCNTCAYYEGVHGARGHAPCSLCGRGCVLWNNYCPNHKEFNPNEDSD